MTADVAGSGRAITFVGGKGGVGKTTTATALACEHAAAGRRTLLVSTDPAHSTGDLLRAALGDAPLEVAPRLWAVEIDGEAAADVHVERVRRDAHRLVSPEVRATVDRHLDLARRAAGTLESAVLDRLTDHLLDEAGAYEHVVVDTAPTGHTLRLLAMPELLAGWVEGLVAQRERARSLDRFARHLAGDDDPPDDPVVTRLRARRDRLGRLRERLHRDAVVHLVVLPERLPVEETVRAARVLREADLTVGTVVVNQVIPDEADGAFVAARRRQQHEHLTELTRRLPDRPQVRVPQLAHDLRGPEDLREVRAALASLVPGAVRPARPGS